MLKDIQSKNLHKSSNMMYRIFYKCLPSIIKSIEAIVENEESKKLEDLQKEGLSGRGKLLLSIYLMGPETVASIVFSNLTRIVGAEGAGEEMYLINKISDAILINLKYRGNIHKKLPVIVKKK